MMRTKRNSQAAVLTLLLALLPGMALANAGKILFARGDVSIESQAGERTAAEQGDAVSEGDRVRTGNRSMAQLRLSDGALVSLRANSDYQIVAQKDEGDLLEQAGKLFSGWMRTVTGAIGEKNPEGVSQETPVATIGIRGTTYQVIHIPAEGLPDFPDTPPGTYIYLQEGAIEATGGAEVRFMEPGDVVYVPLDGGAPMPAPQWLHLFGGGDDDDGVGGDDFPDRGDRLTRDDLESTDALNDALGETQSGPGLFASPGAVAHYYDSDGVIQEVSVDPSSVDVATVNGENALVYAEGQNSYSSTVALSANDGAAPVQTGSAVLPSGSEKINWGIWAQSDYQVVGGTKGPNPAHQMHYMIGTNTLHTYNDLLNAGLTGSFQYSYAGGTALADSAGATLLVNGTSSIDVDFDNMSMRVNLDLSNGESYFTVSPTGAPISNFYDSAGISLQGTPTSSLGGSINGKFTGQDAEGVITNIYIGDGQHQGTGAFEQNGSIPSFGGN